MIKCVYVGGDSCEIGNREFNAIGQAAEFSEAEFRDVVLGRASFILEEDFRRIEFTDDELKKWGAPGERFETSASFADKLALAHGMFRDLHARVLRGEAVDAMDLCEEVQA